MPDPTAQTPQDKPAPAPVPVPEPAERRLRWQGPDGRSIDYTARAECLPVHFFDDGSLVGAMFMLSYVADGEENADRPVTFLWNGGPGGSSSMVNIGGLGPHRVAVPKPEALPNPSPFEDNPYTLLQQSDLVFIDAFGTGFSKVDPSFDAKKVWGVDGDASVFASGIAAWLQAHHRWNAPLYLYGESYGTTRNAVVYRVLGERGIGVTGMVQQSSILDFAPMLPGNDDYYLGMVPLYAMAARHFGKAGAGTKPEQWWDEAVAFVEDELSVAVTKGDNLDPESMGRVSGRMAELVGLPAAFIAKRGLRIELDDFRANILADEGLTCGRYDMRFTTYGYQPVQCDTGFFAEEDPSMSAIDAPYQGAYLKLVEETGFMGDPNYEGLSLKVNEAWNWSHKAPGTMGPSPVPDVSFDISCALRRNPRSRIFFIGGYYDAATPYWNVRHDMAKLFLPEQLKAQVAYRAYECGHMSYAANAELDRMAADLDAFYEGTLE